MVEWENKDYVAQVQAIDPCDNLVYLSYMESGKDGLYRWPLNDDFSWQSFSTLKQKVSLILDAGQSSQRVQYFSLLD